MTEMVEVVVGVIGRAHGIRGDVIVDVRTDEPDTRFAVGAVLQTEDRRRNFTVTAARNHSGRFLVTFAELGDRTAAEQARGTRLVVQVPVDETPDEEGVYYDRQLIGLRVQDASGAEVGTVTAVIHLPAQDLLELDTANGTRMIPFVAALVPDVDLVGGFLRLADVPGLLSDNEDRGDEEDTVDDADQDKPGHDDKGEG
jgi:16S rRNA processing protein RimM